MTGRPATAGQAKQAAAPAELEGFTGRIVVIDGLRGIALIAMVLYHLAWLTNLFGYTRFDLFYDPFWLGARTAILSSFLVISGFMMGLAGERPRSWTRWIRRVGMLAGAAALVTIGTLYSFPDAYIFFGVLHCLTVSAVLALAFLRLPWWGVALSALAWLSVTRLPLPAIDHPWFLWLGLVSELPVTNDYVPIFPWFGVVLAGMAAGKLAGPPDRVRRATSALPVPAWLAWPGRHTLPLYLLHPPLIMGVLLVLSKIVPPPPALSDTAGFMNQCMSGCGELELSAGECTAYCGCVLDGLQQADIWIKVRRSAMDADSQRQLIDITLQCRSAIFGTLPVPAMRPNAEP